MCHSVNAHTQAHALTHMHTCSHVDKVNDNDAATAATVAAVGFTVVVGIVLERLLLLLLFL